MNNLIDKLKQLLTSTYNEKTSINDYISKMRSIYSGENFKERKNGSNFVSREVFKQIEQLKSHLKHPFISNESIIELEPSAVGSREWLIQSKKIIDFFFKKNKRYNLINDILSVLLIEGTVVLRTGWLYKGEKRKVKVPIFQEDVDKIINEQIENNPELKLSLSKMPDEAKQKILNKMRENILKNFKIKNGVYYTEVEKEFPIVNEPTVYVVPNEDIFIDPTASNVDEINFVIQRKYVTLDELEKEGIYTNLDKIYLKVKNGILDDESLGSNVQKYFKQPDLNTSLFNRIDEEFKTKKITMYEFWGKIDINNDGNVKDMVICWIDDIIVRIDENPYPDKKIPFIIAQYIKQPFSVWGRSLADLLEEHQIVKTGIMRGIFDNLALANSRQVGILKGMLDPVNLKRYLNGEVYEFNIPNQAGFKEMNYKRIPPEVFNMLSVVEQDEILLTGIAPLNAPSVGSGLDNSNSSNNGTIPNVIIREVDQIYNISENIIKPLIRKWLSYCYEFLEPSEISAITGSKFIEIDNELIDLIIDRMNITIETDAIDKIKAQQLSFLLQTLGNNIPLDMTKIIMAEIAKYMNMNDLEFVIKNYNPQPNPIEQQMQQLTIQKMQLENELLKAEIQRKMSDANYKITKSKEHIAKTNKIFEDIKQEQIQEQQNSPEIAEIFKNINIDNDNTL